MGLPIAIQLYRKRLSHARLVRYPSARCAVVAFLFRRQLRPCPPRNTLKSYIEQHKTPRRRFKEPASSPEPYGHSGKQGAILRILTWRPARRRLESWLTAIFGWILARTRRRLSRLDTNSTAGSRLFASTKSCSTSWSVLKARPPKTVPSPNPLPRRLHRENPKEKPRERRKAKQHPLKRASRLRKNRRRPPTGKWACWSGSIFLRTKNFPNSAGWIASRPRSLSRALHRKLFITTTRNSNRSTGNSKLLSDLTARRITGHQVSRPNWLQSSGPRVSQQHQFGRRPVEIRYN